MGGSRIEGDGSWAQRGRERLVRVAMRWGSGEGEGEGEAEGTFLEGGEDKCDRPGGGRESRPGAVGEARVAVGGCAVRRFGVVEEDRMGAARWSLEQREEGASEKEPPRDQPITADSG